jgi:hypothetical protein
MKLVTIASGQGSLGHCDDSGPDAIIDVLQRRFVQDKPVIDAIECPKSNLTLSIQTSNSIFLKILEISSQLVEITH